MSAAVHVGEYEDEPIHGLPECLPTGEEILWQGAPSWRALARRSLHVRKVAAYFGLLVVWRLAIALRDGEAFAAAAASAAGLVVLGAAAVVLLAGIAWLNQRATVYTITNRRIVLRFGVALPMAVNLPFRAIQSAGLRVHSDGSGDIPLSVSGIERIGYALMWPHARPWKLGRHVQPMLRSVPEAAAVARALARALAASTRAMPDPASADVPEAGARRTAAVAAV